ncbi:MAG: hypothetical protein AB8E82_05295 [Aureispira sp.]
MHCFYFNDECLPQHDNPTQFSQWFQNTLLVYNKLVTNKDPNLKIDPAILCGTLPSNITLGQDYTLQHIIDAIPNKDLRTLAYAYFTKKHPPLESHIDTHSYEEGVFENNYSIVIDNTPYEELMHLPFMSFHQGFLFTVPVHIDLCMDYLQLDAAQADSIRVDNLHATNQENIQYITDKIQTLNTANASLFEQLEMLLNDPIYHKSFKKSFDQLSKQEQESILRKFKDAVDQDTIDNPDNNTIKDVTRSSNKAKCTVLELRIYSPVALRLYFNKTNGKIYLGTTENKSNSNQSTDIQKAETIIYKLLLTN